MSEVHCARCAGTKKVCKHCGARWRSAHETANFCCQQVRRRSAPCANHTPSIYTCDACDRSEERPFRTWYSAKMRLHYLPWAPEALKGYEVCGSCFDVFNKYEKQAHEMAWDAALTELEAP